MVAKPKVLIVGAGIGGLSAALALLRRGFDVDVYERALELGEVGAGLHVSPNGARVLIDLGLGEAIAKVAVRPKQRVMRLWNTGEGWELPGHDIGAEERYGAPYLLLHRADLHAALLNGVLAQKPDAVHAASPAIGFSQDMQGVTLHLTDGRAVTGAALIAADGIKSIFREQMFGPVSPRFTGFVYWRGLVPIDRVPERARTAATGWLGPSGYATVYPVRRGELLNFNGNAQRDDWQVESWIERGSREECLADFAGWHNDIQQIIHNIETPYKWGSFIREPLQTWATGRVALLGDACHPMLASLGQGGVMALEDGLILARCLAAYSDDLERALERYQAARVGRATRIVQASNDQRSRRLRPELADSATAHACMEALWNTANVNRWYDWIFDCDPVRSAI